MGGGGEVMKNLQWGADRTRKKYPAYEKFHKDRALSTLFKRHGVYSDKEFPVTRPTKHK